MSGLLHLRLDGFDLVVKLVHRSCESEGSYSGGEEDDAPKEGARDDGPEPGERGGDLDKFEGVANEPCGSIGDETEGGEVAILEWGNYVGYVGG